MNYWLRRAELKEIAHEIHALLGGKFSSPKAIANRFKQIKSIVYNKHPKITDDALLHLQIVEVVPGKQYIVSSVCFESEEFVIN